MPFPAFRSPSWTENSMSELFMSAIRFGTPVWACVSEYGKSPQSPIAYSKVFLFVSPFEPTAMPVTSAAAASAARMESSGLRVIVSSFRREEQEPAFCSRPDLGKVQTRALRLRLARSFSTLEPRGRQFGTPRGPGRASAAALPIVPARNQTRGGRRGRQEGRDGHGSKRRQGVG